MKTVSLKRTKTERKAEKDTLGHPGGYEDEDGADLHLECDHIKKLSEKGETTAPLSSLPHGHEIHFEGHGTIHRTSDGPEGGRIHIKVHRLGTEYDNPKEEYGDEDSVRGSLERNTDASEKRAEAKATKREKKADTTGYE